MAKNEAKIKFTAETGEFNSAISKANSELSELRAELKLNRAQMETAGTSVDGLKKEYDLLQTELSAAQSKSEALAEKIKVATKYYGENSQEVSKLRTQLANAQTQEEKIKQAISKCNTELKEAETAFDNAGDAADEAGDDAEASGEGWTIVKDIIADMAKEAISWAVESFKELMTVADDALATLGARTGATTGEMQRYKGVMDDIYRNNYGESFEDIGDAMGTAIQIFGDLDDVSLQNITQNAIVLRDTFGMDYTESLRAVNSLMDQFGLTADEAFNLIAQGAQQGLNQNGDLLDVINEYSVQFDAAGYSAEDMFNMLKNGSEAGTWSVDKLGDAVKEFNIRAKDGTAVEALKEYQEQLGLSDEEIKQLSDDMKAGGTKGKKAFKTILTALMDVDDETAQYQAGVALFGTMWEDLGANTVESLMNTEGEISKTKSAMDDMANTKYDTLSSAIGELGRVIQSDLIQPLVDIIVPVAKDIVQWLIDNMDTIGPIIIGIATALGVLATALGISALIKGVTAAFALLNTTLLANPITLIVAAVAGLVAAFVALWNNCEGFRQFWIDLWENIKAVFSAVWEAIKTAWEAAATWFSNLFTNAWNGIKSAWSGVSNWFSNLWEGIKNIFNVVITWFSNLFTNAWNGIVNAWSGVKNWFSNLWNGIKNIFSSLATWFSNLFKNAWNGIVNAWSGVKNWFSNLWNGIKNIFNVVTTWFSNLFTNAWKGITNAWSGVKNWFGNLWDGIKNVFSSVGSWFGNIFTTAWNNIKNAFSSIGNFFSGIWNNIKSIFSNVGTAIATGIKSAVSSAVNAVLSTACKIINGFIDAINIAIGIINLIPGVNIGKIKRLSVPALEMGGVVDAATLAMIGENGKEAVVPLENNLGWLDKLAGMLNDKMANAAVKPSISNAVENKMNAVNLENLARSIEDLANRPIQLNINGRQFAMATAGDGDSVNGLRSSFKSRGLVLD